jgi:hypothetical protein
MNETDRVKTIQVISRPSFVQYLLTGVGADVTGFGVGGLVPLGLVGDDVVGFLVGVVVA